MGLPKGDPCDGTRTPFTARPSTAHPRRVAGVTALAQFSKVLTPYVINDLRLSRLLTLLLAVPVVPIYRLKPSLKHNHCKM